MTLAKQIIGFDIGECQLKMVQYENGKAEKAVAVELPDNLVRNGVIQNMEVMADFIKEAVSDRGIPKGDAAVILPESLVYAKNISMPAMTIQQLQYNLPFEFHDYLTEEKNQYYFDYALREMIYEEDEEGNPTEEPKEMRLYACCALKKTVAAYRDMFRRAGFKLKIAVPVSYALGNVLKDYIEATHAESKDYCLVDIGQRGSRIYIFRNDEPDLHRGVDVAVADLDRAIADTNNVEIHMAHTYKLKNYNRVLDSDVAREFYHSLAVEIMKAVNFYNYNNRESMLKEIYLCGGGASLAPLPAALAETTGLKVHNIGELYQSKIRENAGFYPAALGACRE